MFPGAQKMSLEERIDGAPNYRGLLISTIRSLNTPRSSRKECDGPRIYGIGMPTMEAIRSVMIKTGIEKSHDRKLLWTSLREEPVVYVNGRPYVLRLFANPMKNLEATGIIRERVEAMEERMKLDIINELRYYDGRVLLHDEEGDISNFTIIPIWETVSEDDVMTPLDVYKVIQKEGYNIDYLRIPMYHYLT